MKKTIKYLGSTIELAVRLNAGSEEVNVYRQVGTQDKETYLTPRQASIADKYPRGKFIRRDTWPLHEIKLFVDGRQIGSAQKNISALNEAISSMIEEAKKNIEFAGDYSAVDVLSDMGFAESTVV